MFFVILMILLVWFRTQGAESPPGALWFMLSIFAGVGYMAGFLDSRIFARLDRKKGPMLDEIETRQSAPHS